ncbi:MAG: protein kinase [Planctomycetes bacterium]|nr:protein kinase [Planctomycetota bacterium]
MQFAHFTFDPETDRLGEGPLSEVYKAVDEQLGRTVALKILRAHAEIDPQADHRFLREAKHTSNLQHKNIATIYQYGKAEGTSFIAMEYLQGRTLDKIIKDQQQAGRGPTLGLEECVRILREVAEALEYVHRHGLVHRDLKPGNVMVLDDGSVKLLDFGIARAKDEASITQHGMLVGTVLYMSPEQVRGDELDVRSDVFAFGAVAYHVTTGQLPFPGKSFPEVCMAILDGNVKRPALVRPGFPAVLEQLILRCLAPDPAQRFPDAGAVHGALLALEGGAAAANGKSPAATISGTIVLVPVRCSGPTPDSCNELAGSLRKDLVSELKRMKNLQVVALDDVRLPDALDYDWILYTDLWVENGQGRIELRLECFDRGRGPRAPRETLLDRTEFHDKDEWALQDGLVTGAVRVLRKRLAEAASRPAASVARKVDEAIALARQAHEVLHRGMTKQLLASTTMFRRATELDPYCAIAHAGLAEALVRKYLYWDGDTTFLEEAREEANRALALDANCAEAHTALGFSFHLSGHTMDAQREYRRAMQLDNREWLAHRLLGAIYARAGNFKEASPLLRRAIALKPSHIGSYDHLYNVLRRLDRYEESLEIADQGIAAARTHLAQVPDNQEARLHMAMLQARLELDDDARATVQRAREVAPKDGYTAFHCACVHAILGDLAEAIEALTAAQARRYHIQAELQRNTDLDVLRAVPEFQALVG